MPDKALLSVLRHCLLDFKLLIFSKDTSWKRMSGNYRGLSLISIFVLHSFICLSKVEGIKNCDTDMHSNVSTTTKRRETEISITLKILVYTVAIIVSLFGNAIVIIVILQTQGLRTKFNMYIVNLAIADVFMPVFCMWIHLISSSSRQWILGEILCKTHNFFQGKTCIVLPFLFCGYFFQYTYNVTLFII